MIRNIILTTATTLATVMLATVNLQAAPPSVERLSPAAGQRGTTFELTIVGAGLQSTADVMLYGSGISCDRLDAKSDNELVLHLTATAECPTGTHSLRLRSPEGISELLVFSISPFPIVPETESNDAFEDAQSVELNSTLVGTIEAGDVDSFRVTLKRGDRLSVEAEAIRTGGSMLDTVLNVLGPDGSWLAFVDDTAQGRQDPITSLIAPEDGDYIVQLHETNFEGDESSRYSLHIGTFPNPSFVFPPGGQSGTTLTVSFGGDATGAISQEVSLRDLAFGTKRVYANQDGDQSPTGLPFRISPFGNSNEAEPNNAASELSETVAELPIALNGILQVPGDVDCFRIRAEAGQKINVEVFASRLGSSIDSLLEIHRLNGDLVASSDDGLSHDSHTAVTFPATGEYVVRITDKRGNGGEDHFYRIELSPFLPQLTTFLSRPDRRSQERQAIAVPRGNRVLTFLACQRTGFSGDVNMVASGLPEGVQLPSTLVPSDRYWVPMVIEAAADAPIAGGLVDVEASGVSSSGTVIGHFRQVVDLVAASADQLFYAADEDRLAVAVIEEVPYSITLQQPVTSLAPDGTLDLQITATRAEGFDGPLDVSFPFLPPWIDGPEKVTIPKGESSIVYTLRAWDKAKPRTWQICAEAKPGIDSSASSDSEQSAGAQMMRTGSGRGSQRTRVASTPVASNIVDLSIATSPVSGSIGTVIAEQGTPRQLKCSLQVSGALPESLTAVLEGLPNRVTASDVKVDPRSGSVEFELKPESSCPVGEFPDLIVRLSGRMNDQEVSWRVGRGGTLRIEAAGMLFTDDKGQPLSRLERLRREAERKTSPH